MRLVVADVVANGAVPAVQPKVGGANDETPTISCADLRLRLCFVSTTVWLSKQLLNDSPTDSWSYSTLVQTTADARSSFTDLVRAGPWPTEPGEPCALPGCCATAQRRAEDVLNYKSLVPERLPRHTPVVLARFAPQGEHL